MTSTERLDRRTVLKTTGGALAASLLAGCGSDSGGGNGGGGGDSNTVSVVNFDFEPSDVTISEGETVTWEFDTAGHNVSGWPDMDDQISVPDGAEGFGTMEKGGDELATVAEGETFEHTFETAGTYTYVCIPHRTQMVGTITVE